MFLQGQQIALRALEPSDAGILYEWENNMELWPVSFTQLPFSHFILEEFINTAYQDIYTSKQLRLMIVDKENQRSIGTLDLFDFDPQHARAGLGIFVADPHRRTGAAQEAIELAKRYCSSTLMLHQLYVHVGVDNVASLTLFEKAGFVKSGLKKAWTRISKQQFTDTWFLQHIFTAS